MRSNARPFFPKYRLRLVWPKAKRRVLANIVQMGGWQPQGKRIAIRHVLVIYPFLNVK